MGLILLCLTAGGLYIAASKDTIGAAAALGAAMMAPVAAFIVYMCFGGDYVGLSMAVLAYAVILIFCYCSGKKANERREEAVNSYICSCMDFMEDFAHFLPDYSRRAYFSYDIQEKCVMVKFWVHDAWYIGDIYGKPDISDELREKTCFGDYQWKHWACLRAVEEGGREYDDLYYKGSLGFQSDSGVMRYLLKKAQTRFGDKVTDVRSYRMGEDFTFWLRIPGNKG